MVPEMTDRKDVYAMVDILNLAMPYFGLIFIGFACGKGQGAAGSRASPG